MTLCWPQVKSYLRVFCFLPLIPAFVIFSPDIAHALTASVGEPAKGKLINGIQFPAQLINCKLKSAGFSYTTPEVVAGLIEAFESFEKIYPDSCEICIGDFSARGGGRIKGHSSHQNGRDVDIGLFVKGNIPLNGFDRSTPSRLDVVKTWHLVRCIISTGRVECIYLDDTIKAKLYRQAISEGVSAPELSKIFKGASPGGETEDIIRHEPGHRTHMHVRFLTPLSELAATPGNQNSTQMLSAETAQISCLPKRAYHYTAENEKDLAQMAQNLGVTVKSLCRWNGLKGDETPIPGERMVIYKRGADSVNLFSKSERNSGQPPRSAILAAHSHAQAFGVQRPARTCTSHLLAGNFSEIGEIEGERGIPPFL